MTNNELTERGFLPISKNLENDVEVWMKPSFELIEYFFVNNGRTVSEKQNITYSTLSMYGIMYNYLLQNKYRIEGE